MKCLPASVADGLFPNYCCLCGLRSYRPLPLCSACQLDLSPNTNCCEICALPLTSTSTLCKQTQNVCGQCQHSPPSFNRAIAPWLYDRQLAFLIHRWKFHGERRLTPLLAQLWLHRWRANTDHIDLIVPVPLHWTKFWRRGFNQSELFAIELLRRCPSLKGMKLDTRLVQRHRATLAQSGLGALARRTNMLATFTARRRCDNLRIAVVDDVLTTGATAAAMATTLRDAGAAHIEIWCMARTPEPRD